MNEQQETSDTPSIPVARPERLLRSNSIHNPVPQLAPGSSAAVGHVLGNSIPLSIFPISDDKICFCFSGLPGRGKTHIARRLARYLSFFHALPVQIFNVGEYRRRMCGALKDAEWFNDNNEEGVAWREKCNQAALSDMVEYMRNLSMGVAILDGTNGTHAKRLRILQMMRSQGVSVYFIEVDNDNQGFLSQQYQLAASTMPDYEGVVDYVAEADYRKRVAAYSTTFEPISLDHPVEKKWSFLRCNHSRHHYVLHNIRGHLPLKVANFIMNLRTTHHAFYLSRHGQSDYNMEGRIGGDSGLSEHGLAYAIKLAEFVERKITRNAEGQVVPARLWTSTMRRTIETAQFISNPKISVMDADDPSSSHEWVQMRSRQWAHLDEIFAGVCDGMTYEEIEMSMPGEFDLRKKDKLAYRYPRGESYLDVIARIEPVIIEMERHREPVLIIGHQGILRIIYAFYMGLSRNEAPYVSIPLNTVIELNPGAFHCDVQRYLLYEPSEPLSSDGQDEPIKKKSLSSHQLCPDPPSH